MDKASKDRLVKVHPELAKRVTATIGALAAKDMDVRVVQGLRTYAEQNALYAQGRSRKGQIVTKARGGYSNHNFGLAVDLCPFKAGKPDWNDTPAFKAIGAEGKRQKLNWGGDWKSFRDMPHLELPTGMTTKTCRELYGKGNLTAVWKEASRKLGVAAPSTIVTLKAEPADKPSEAEIASAVDGLQPIEDASSTGTGEMLQAVDPPPIVQPQDEVKKTEVTDEGSMLEVTTRNQQDVNVPAHVANPEPYNGIGFWATIKRDLMAVTGGNLSFEGLSTYAQQASGWPEWIVSLLTKAALIVAIGSIGYLLFRVIHFAVDSLKKSHKFRTEAMIATDVNRKDLEEAK